MKRLLLIWIAVLSLFLVALTPGFAQQEDTCYSKNGTWNAEQQKCELRSGVVVNVTYPLELVGSGIAEQTLDNFINESQTQFIQSYAPDFSLPAYANYWSMDVTYELYSFSEQTISVKLNIYTYTGGAHPNLEFATYTFDLAGQRPITLNDLFLENVNPWPVIAPLVQQSLTAQLGEMADAQWIQQGTGEDPANYQNFALTPDSLIFFFPPYQVTAYAAGPQRVDIPLVDISSLLRPEFIPSANG